MNITRLLQGVAQKARKCPQPTLIHAYREAARRFCGESRWLRRQLIVPTVIGVDQYDLVAPNGDPTLEIIGVRVVTVDVDGIRRYRIDPSDPTGWRPEGTGNPRTWCYVPEGMIAVHPVPDVVCNLVCTLECQPLVDTEEISDDLVPRWGQKLDSGALAYLYDTPGQPWSNPANAVKEAKLFQAGINNAKADVARAYNTGTSMARIPRLF